MFNDDNNGMNNNYWIGQVCDVKGGLHESHLELEIRWTEALSWMDEKLRLYLTDMLNCYEKKLVINICPKLGKDKEYTRRER